MQIGIGRPSGELPIASFVLQVGGRCLAGEAQGGRQGADLLSAHLTPVHPGPSGLKECSQSHGWFGSWPDETRLDPEQQFLR
jgi:hypothetical protein